MRLIALDTATGAPTACLWADGVVVAGWEGPLRSGPPAVVAGAMRLLEEAGWRLTELDALAFGRGPGAFTGVRLGVAVAQGLALGAGLPVVPVSDLAALACNAYRERGWQRVLACLDARQREVYWGAYRIDADGEPRNEGREAVGAPAEVVAPPGDWGLAGSGAGMVPWNGTAAPDVVPDARAVAAIAAGAAARGETVAAEAAAPCYLRNRVATPSPRRHNQFLP